MSRLRRPPLLLVLCVLALGALALAQPSGPQARGPRQIAAAPDVLIVHDSLPGPLPSGLVGANNVLDLLGHFGLQGTVLPIESYKAGEIARHRFVFVLGIDDRIVTYPPALLADVRAATIPVFWVFKHIQELVATPQDAARLGFRPAGPVVHDGLTSVSYNGISLLKGEPDLQPIEILDAARVPVLARSEGEGGRSEPCVVRSGSFWYSADSPFAYVAEGDRYWAFCDLLHDFFGMPHQRERKALLRLEDISVEDDPERLIALADYLASRDVPFQISLIPIFKDPENGEEIYLSDRPQFVRAIRHMVSKGGLVVLHGVTHQYRGRSADDFEFWDRLANRPIHNDSPVLVEQKLRLGLEECFKNRIYPVTWETPHYMASAVDYQTFARYFNSSYERVASMNNSETGNHFPYWTVDRYGRFIIPESLGFIPMDKPDPGLLATNAGRMQVVRDGVASFFFHPFLDRGHLAAALDGIERSGYTFQSIRDYDLRVQMDERLVQTYTDSVRLDVHGRYLHRLLVHADGRVSNESYSQRPLSTTVVDPGVVPPDAVLVMEGVSQVAAAPEPPPPGWWDRVKGWLASKIERKDAGGTILAQPQVVVVTANPKQKGDSNNEKSYAAAFAAFGFRTTTRTAQELARATVDRATIVAVPSSAATALDRRQVEWLADWVRSGGRLILDGESQLAKALGVRHEKRSLKVRRVRDLYGSPDVGEIAWKPAADVGRFTVAEPLTVYAVDVDSELPLSILGRAGSGRFLYLATRFDPNTTLGYTRYPYLVHSALAGFGLKLPLQRAQLELYFDPGSHGNDPIERLAEEWRRLGVRAIYAAGYHFWPSWSYPYANLIDVMHRNGILVYCWLELPHVSRKFWEDHPEWRAKTATGLDAGDKLVGWRDHMDLDIPECRSAVFEFVEDLVRRYNWDGVNVAELNYDTLGGPENPKGYLPMGAAARSAFQASAGFDARLLFDPASPYHWRKNTAALRKFEAYRSQRVLEWHRALLQRIAPIAAEREMEMIVTMLDSLAPRSTVTRDTGVDSRQIVGLMDEFSFTLQVEDPAQFWAETPERYRQFTETYLKLVRDRRRLMFDINVVPDRTIERSPAPAPTMVGIELAHALNAASSASGRAGIYSTKTVPFEDLQLLARVLAHDARMDRGWRSWVTESDRPVLVTAPGQWLNFEVDGKPWPGWGENEVYIPPGRHEIAGASRGFQLFDRSLLDLRLLRFTGTLGELVHTKRGLRMTYDSPMRAVALVNRQPFEIHVDGQPSQEPPLEHSGHWSVRLPRGRHTVEIVADSTAYVILESTSLYSSTLIVIFGGVACGVMLLLYVSILARRAFARAGQERSVPHPTHPTGGDRAP